MEILEALEKLGYIVEIDPCTSIFTVNGQQSESLPSTVWNTVQDHREEIRQALIDRRVQQMSNLVCLERQQRMEQQTQVYEIGDIVNVVNVDPSVPECRDYLTAHGEVIAVDFEAYGRLGVVVRVTEVNQSVCKLFKPLCFCPEELEIEGEV